MQTYAYVRNKKTNAISCISASLASDYLETGEWLLADRNAYEKQQNAVVEPVVEELETTKPSKKK